MALVRTVCPKRRDIPWKTTQFRQNHSIQTKQTIVNQTAMNMNLFGGGGGELKNKIGTILFRVFNATIILLLTYRMIVSHYLWPYITEYLRNHEIREWTIIVVITQPSANPKK
jgi:hypothetical protein